MKGNKFIIVALGFFLMAGLFAPLAIGENDSLNVVMTVADRNYSVGDTITIQLRVYDKGVLTDAPDTSNVYVGMSTHHNHNNPSNLTVTKQSTGIYQTTYTVTGANNNNHLYFFYEVTVTNDYEEGELVIHVYSIQDKVDITIGGQESVPAYPGDVLVATVLVRTGETPIPITGFTQLYLEAPDGTRQNLSHTIRETGIYDVNVIAPAVSISGLYQVVAQPLGVGVTDRAYIHLNVLDVWYHKISTSGNTVSFEVCVANSEGAPVDGANFFIQRMWSNAIYMGVTNASGKSLVHVTDIAGSVSFTGYVLAGGLNQTIQGAVFNTVAEQPDHNDFDIMWEGTETIFKPNTQVTVPYGAYDARVPASGKTIFYYVTASGTDFAVFGNGGNHVEAVREVIASGSVVTDNLGKFNIAFRTPTVQSAISVRLEVPLDNADFQGRDYDLDDDKYYAVWDGVEFYAYQGKLDGDGGVSLNIGSFQPGKAGQVTINPDAALGDPIYALWGVGESSIEDMANYDPEWMCWVPAGSVIQLSIDEDGKYQGDFLLPEFIEDQDVTVLAGYVDSDGIPHFDAKTASPGSDLPWLWIIIIIIIIVAVIAVIAVAKAKMVI